MVEDAIEVAKDTGIWELTRTELEDSAWDEWEHAEPDEPHEPWEPGKDESDEEIRATQKRLNRLAGGSGIASRRELLAWHAQWETEHASWEKAHVEWEEAEPSPPSDESILVRVLARLDSASPRDTEYVSCHALARMIRMLAVTDTRNAVGCENCGRPFKARAGARYCSGRCRVAAHRAGVSAASQ